MLTKPSRLRKGDRIGIVAPASPLDRESLQHSIQFLEELGLKVKMGKHVYNEYGYLAGVDQDRLNDLHMMFLDKEVKAVFCARGGYGTGRIAAQLDYELIKKHPKIFWGYSDITFLNTAIRQQTGLVTFHGPMLASDIGKEDVDPLSKEGFKQLFEPTFIQYTEDISPLETIIDGKVEGDITGGNLSILVSTLGTSFEINTKGKLLLIEEINEEPRAIDRMLNQLYMAGKLSDAKGLIIGDFNNCVPKGELSLSLDEVIYYYTEKANKPALKGFKFGHCNPQISIPLGVKAEMDTEKKQLIIENGIE